MPTGSAKLPMGRSQASKEMETRASTPESSIVRTFSLVFFAMAALFATDTFLAKLEESESRTEGSRLFKEGQSLAQEGRYLQAIDRFRGAVSITRDQRDYQLALAQVLLAAGKLPDAEAVSNQLLQRDSTDGAANLTMAHVLVKQGKIEDATSYYHRAIYGRWKEDGTEQRVKVRLELVDLLASHDAKQELLAELLPLQDASGIETAVRMRIARLYLAAGSPSRASEMFQAILREQPQDPDAYAGLGDAEFAKGNYRAARSDFQTALKSNPENPEIRQRLELANQVLLLDPAQRGLSSSERHRRSVRLVELAMDSLKQCVGLPAPQSVQNAIDDAQNALKRRVRAQQESDAAEANLDLAEELWKIRRNACKQPETTAEKPLTLVLAKLAQ
jgi:tetratricopeptide (TPR) repeat protein